MQFKNRQEFAEWFAKNRSLEDEVKNNCDTDNEGQLMIYTGWYEWSDGTVRNYGETPEDI